MAQDGSGEGENLHTGGERYSGDGRWGKRKAKGKMQKVKVTLNSVSQDFQPR